MLLYVNPGTIFMKSIEIPNEAGQTNSGPLPGVFVLAVRHESIGRMAFSVRQEIIKGYES